MSTILGELGLDIATISGDEEAELTFQGLPENLRGSGSILAADIGGASTELIEAVDGIRGQSFLSDRIRSIDRPVCYVRSTLRHRAGDRPAIHDRDSPR